MSRLSTTRPFCRRVSDALAMDYQLAGSPALTHDGARVIVGQALLWDVTGRAPAPQDKLLPAIARRSSRPSTDRSRRLRGGRSGRGCRRRACRAGGTRGP
ncbi:MAG: DUF1737 domain-containing protein [Thermoleophilaceae bacterium]